MRIIRFDAEVGKGIDRYGSANVSRSRIAQLIADADISCMHFNPQGVIGFHQAVTPQLLLVVAGSGWARGDSNERVPVSAGQAALWDKDEWHESGSESGMTAIVIEGASVNLPESASTMSG
ncbi:MAG: cupin [Chloroflexi bacterium]|nr:cupin [Chloroflexota bacterium]MBI5828531.1 cupin [Chloroflexota bacterium]